VECLGCHVPTLGEQVNEALSWVSGNYVAPLQERKLKNLVEARGLKADDFCLNDSCHHVSSKDNTPINSREDLVAATSENSRNPHLSQHETLACDQCHKAHRASVIYCSQCHNDAPLPDGWLTYAQSTKLDKPA